MTPGSCRESKYDWSLLCTEYELDIGSINPEVIKCILCLYSVVVTLSFNAKMVMANFECNLND